MLIANIRHIVNNETGIDPLSNTNSHLRINSMPRQLFATMVKLHTSKTLQEIADITGNKVHSTIISSIKTVNNLCDTDKSFKEKYDRINFRICEYKLKNK